MRQTMRQQYLQHWTPYLGYQSGTGFRVITVNEQGIRLKSSRGETLLSGTSNVALTVAPGKTWKHLTMQHLAEIISPGDWLILHCRNQLLETLDTSDIDELLLAVPTQAEVSNAKNHALDFCRFIEDVRSFFLSEGLFPAQTPSLVACPGMEPPLTPFRVDGAYLPTSPELSLKKLLCKGYGDLFEIKRVFRKELTTSHHQPEFLMLEWYRTFATLEKIEQDLKKLINYLSNKGWRRLELGLESWESRSVRELFLQELDFSLQPETPHAELIQLAHQLKVGFLAEDDSWDDTFFKIFLSRIEPTLQAKGFFILKDYPPSQAALARLTDDGWADRRELYIRGIEVGNGFNELNDPELQKQRFEADVLERKQRGLEPLPIDKEFLQHLRSGLPPCAGIAIGLERLYMGLMGVADIRELIEFPKQG